MQLESHTEFQKTSSTKFTELTLHEYLSPSNPRWQISNRNEAAPKISVRTVFVQGAASARFPEEGGDVFHRVVHAVEMLFLLRPVRFPARHGQDAHSRQFRRGPDVTAHESGISSVNPHSAICKYP